MKPKPKKRGPGRPRTTGMNHTKPVRFRVSEAQREELAREAKALGLASPDLAAKLRAFPKNA